ncbi:tumor necrosis factor receptor superfamily member 14 [Amia ocellicauda]|uniref:tumor necrosis factor receptor superfamily member 14 n=1 Tax=Amia ocellicauda TaxID=2972642 RepID=UPI0034646D05
MRLQNNEHFKMKVSFGMWFCVLLSCMTTSYGCNNAKEYDHGGICCPKCSIGTHVKKHCDLHTSTSCSACASATYMDQPTGLTECKRCRMCEAETGMRYQKTCTAEANAVCRCNEGLFCSNSTADGCSQCQNYTVCSLGQFVKEKGSLENDTVCADCPRNHSSAEDCNADCQEKCKENTGARLVTFKGIIFAIAGISVFLSSAQ